jgi:hypothetical protein
MYWTSLTKSRQASLAGGQNITTKQTAAICPSTKYGPLISYQLAIDPAGGKKVRLYALSGSANWLQDRAVEWLQ